MLASLLLLTMAYSLSCEPGMAPRIIDNNEISKCEYTELLSLNAERVDTINGECPDNYIITEWDGEAGKCTQYGALCSKDFLYSTGDSTLADGTYIAGITSFLLVVKDCKANFQKNCPKNHALSGYTLNGTIFCHIPLDDATLLAGEQNTAAQSTCQSINGLAAGFDHGQVPCLKLQSYVSLNLLSTSSGSTMCPPNSFIVETSPFRCASVAPPFVHTCPAAEGLRGSSTCSRLPYPVESEHTESMECSSNRIAVASHYNKLTCASSGKYKMFDVSYIELTGKGPFSCQDKWLTGFKISDGKRHYGCGTFVQFLDSMDCHSKNNNRTFLIYKPDDGTFHCMPRSFLLYSNQKIESVGGDCGEDGFVSGYDAKLNKVYCRGFLPPLRITSSTKYDSLSSGYNGFAPFPGPSGSLEASRYILRSIVQHSPHFYFIVSEPPDHFYYWNTECSSNALMVGTGHASTACSPAFHSSLQANDYVTVSINSSQLTEGFFSCPSTHPFIHKLLYYSLFCVRLHDDYSAKASPFELTNSSNCDIKNGYYLTGMYYHNGIFKKKCDLLKRKFLAPSFCRFGIVGIDADGKAQCRSPASGDVPISVLEPVVTDAYCQNGALVHSIVSGSPQIMYQCGKSTSFQLITEEIVAIPFSNNLFPLECPAERALVGIVNHSFLCAIIEKITTTTTTTTTTTSTMTSTSTTTSQPAASATTKPRATTTTVETATVTTEPIKTQAPPKPIITTTIPATITESIVSETEVETSTFTPTEATERQSEALIDGVLYNLNEIIVKLSFGSDTSTLKKHESQITDYFFQLLNIKSKNSFIIIEMSSNPTTMICHIKDALVSTLTKESVIEAIKSDQGSILFDPLLLDASSVEANYLLSNGSLPTFIKRVPDQPSKKLIFVYIALGGGFIVLFIVLLLICYMKRWCCFKRKHVPTSNDIKSDTTTIRHGNALFGLFPETTISPPQWRYRVIPPESNAPSNDKSRTRRRNSLHVDLGTLTVGGRVQDCVPLNFTDGLPKSPSTKHLHMITLERQTDVLSDAFRDIMFAGLEVPPVLELPDSEEDGM